MTFSFQEISPGHFTYRSKHPTTILARISSKPTRVSHTHRFGYRVFLHGRLFFVTKTLQTLPRGTRPVCSLRPAPDSTVIYCNVINDLRIWSWRIDFNNLALVKLPGTVICEYKARERIHRDVLIHDY